MIRTVEGARVISNGEGRVEDPLHLYLISFNDALVFFTFSIIVDSDK